MAMIGNNLSTLGVSAAQLDNTLDTTSFMLQWLPTTGEFGLYGTFGDFDYHEKLATRLGAALHAQPRGQAEPARHRTRIENSQIRLTDGSVIFTPDLFGPGITVEKVDYDMVEPRRRDQVQGPVARGRVLLALAERLRGHRTPPGSPTSTTTGSRCRPRRWRSADTLQVYLERLGDPRPLRRRLGDAGRGELVLHEGARPPAQRRVAAPEQLPRGIHGRSLPRGRQRRRLPPNFEMNF